MTTLTNIILALCPIFWLALCFWIFYKFQCVLHGHRPEKDPEGKTLVFGLSYVKTNEPAGAIIFCSRCKSAYWRKPDWKSEPAPKTQLRVVT